MRWGAQYSGISPGGISEVALKNFSDAKFGDGFKGRIDRRWMPPFAIEFLVPDIIVPLGSTEKQDLGERGGANAALTSRFDLDNRAIVCQVGDR